MQAPVPFSATILLVDDEDDVRLTTKWFLGNFGFAVDSVRNAAEALALFDPGIHDVVVTNNLMPGMNGVEMAHVIKLRSPLTPVVIYSLLPPNDTSCVDLLIRRPAHLMVLKQGIEQLLARRHQLPFTNPPRPEGKRHARAPRRH